MPGEDADAILVEHIANELADCRKRGIERLDVHTHNQVPLAVPELRRLASEYATARGLALPAGTAQIKQLLRDTLEVLLAENQPDAELIRDLFFGDSAHTMVMTAGELLDIARKKSGDANEARFRARRNAAFVNFALFLVNFVADTRRSHDDLAVTPAAPLGSGIGVGEDAAHYPPDTEFERHSALTGYVGDGNRFVRLLAEAVNVTIVGFTNETLSRMLANALARKRAALRQPDAFWESIRIVFISDQLLDSINDERPEYPDPGEARRQRHQAAFNERRSVGAFLHRGPEARWAIYESPYLPSLIGTLFEMPDGGRVVQLLIRHPRRRSPDHLFLELGDTTSHYFSAAFEDVVRSSVSDDKIIPVGVPRAGKFYCTGTRFRPNVLRDGSGATGWVPVVLVVTWRNRNGHPEPLLQLRTEVLAARELNSLSHLSAYIVQDDYLDQAAGEANPGRVTVPLEFDLQHPGPSRAARRRLQAEASEELPGQIRPHASYSYLNPDKEHLFFFVYTYEFPRDFQLPRRADMHHVPLPELFAIRENQALRMAALLCQAPAMSPRIRAAAWEIAGLNLLLHDHTELASRLMSLPGWQGPSDRDTDEIRRLAEQTRQTWFPGGQEVQLTGLAGLQYRNFFTFLLPLYAEFGVQGAAEQLAVMGQDEDHRAAISRLSELYQDEELMTAIPVEL